MLQGLDGRLCLLHIQVDDAYLLVGHRPPQFVVTPLGIVEHSLGFLQGLLQPTQCTQGVGFELPGAVIIVPLTIFVEPLHLDFGFFELFLCLRVILQGDYLLPTGLALLFEIACPLLVGYQLINLCKGCLCGILALCRACINRKASYQKE